MFSETGTRFLLQCVKSQSFSRWVFDFDFDIVNFPFLDGDVPRSTSYGVYISQLIHPVMSMTLILGKKSRKENPQKLTQCCYFCEPSCLFYLSFNFDFYVSKIMRL